MRRRLILDCPTARQWLPYFFLSVLLTHQHFITVSSDTVPPTTKFREVQSVSGSVGQIPCPVTSFDEVVMILWFKGSSGAPIYSYDARKEELEPRHMTLKDDWGLRLYFRVWPNNRRSPALMIQDLKPGDGGLYRCRVDYRDSPTTNAVTRLKIIEPPTRLEIRDTSASPRPISDQQLKSGNKQHSDPTVTYMGPYSEGQNVTLVCSAYGGKPLPEVRWYKNGEVVDTSYSLSGTEYTVNELGITNLARNHTVDIYSCQANNNNETQALSHKVLLEIYLGVTSVELEVPSPMTAGSEYHIVCKTIGAYPTVKVEFWKNLKRILSRSQMKSFADNVTITSLTYKPDVVDDGTTIKCIAENPWVSKKPSVARRTMKIKYIPIAVLRLGRNRTAAFSEWESVLMECHVKANPPAHTILWFHQGRQLGGGNNETAGIRINGMTLFISSLTHKLGGEYQCEAKNDVGKGISNTLPIELHLSPKCVTSEVTQVPLAVGETNWLTCNILAWPSDLNFYWTLNRSESRNGKLGSGGGGSIILSRNLTELYHNHNSLVSPSSMAHGINVTVSSGKKSNSSTIRKTEGKEKGASLGGMEDDSRNQNGYPQLSSPDFVSSSPSLDYPEDEHMPFDSSAKTGTQWENTEKKGTPVGREKSHSTEEMAISEKEEQTPLTYSHSDVVSSTSTRDGLRPRPNNNLKNGTSPYTSSKQWISPANEKLTSPKLVTGERKMKRHVKEGEPQQQQPYYHNHPSSPILHNNEERTSRNGFQDKIRHTSLLSYQVRSEEDYGTVTCWATNSLGSQVFPCLFHIVKKEDEPPSFGKGTGKQTKAKATGKLGNLTVPSSSSTTGLSDSEVMLNGLESSSSSSDTSTGPQRGFSKLQKTLGIVLLLLLIFIAGLAGLAFAMLFVLARRRRGAIQRIVISQGVGLPSTASTVSGSSNSSRSNSKNGIELFIGAFSGRRKRNSLGKGAATAVSKYSQPPPENIISSKQVEVESDAGEKATACFPSSADMFLVSGGGSSMHPFQENAKDTNKGNPQLSCISSDMGANTFWQSNTAAVSPSYNDAQLLRPRHSNRDGDSGANNNNTNINTNTTTGDGDGDPSFGEKDIEPSFPPPTSLHCFSDQPQTASPSLDVNTSLKAPFPGDESKIGMERFGTMTMTRRAVELFVGDANTPSYCSTLTCNNDDVDSVSGGQSNQSHFPSQRSTLQLGLARSADNRSTVEECCCSPLDEERSHL